jgi:AcrR family transcriptional regulator
MAPKEISYSRDIVLKAALEVVRDGGLDGLTARNVASALSASVAPVYKAFGSMDDLTRAVLEEIRRLMEERARQPLAASPFLNVGVGIVVFARDENALFRALFHSRHHCPEIIEAFYHSILERMKADEMLGWLPENRLGRLLDGLWLYTIGLATAIIFGQLVDPGTENVVRLLKSMGNILMFAEVADIADWDSPSNEKEWTRLLQEKKVVLPASKSR